MTLSGACCFGVASSNGYKFTGKERDAESGLDMFRGQVLRQQPRAGSCRPIGLPSQRVPYASFGNPQSLNLYSYVNNNPTTTRDPDGHCPYVIYENLAAQTPEQIQQRSQAVTNIVVGIGKGLWNMVADTWNTGAELLNDQG